MEEKMEDIKFVKLVLQIQPVESFLNSFKKIFVFDGDHFNDCETIEEIRDKIENEGVEERIEYTHIYTYTTKENLEKDEQYEYIGY